MTGSDPSLNRRVGSPGCAEGSDPVCSVGSRIARVDGAGDLRIFLQVILPLSLPALGTCAVFGFLMIWDQYLLPLLVAQSPHMNTLTLVVTSLQASQEQGEGVRLAAAVVLMIPSILIYLGLQRLFERGLLSGSLKG